MWFWTSSNQSESRYALTKLSSIRSLSFCRNEVFMMLAASETPARFAKHSSTRNYKLRTKGHHRPSPLTAPTIYGIIHRTLWFSHLQHLIAHRIRPPKCRLRSRLSCGLIGYPHPKTRLSASSPQLVPAPASSSIVSALPHLSAALDPNAGQGLLLPAKNLRYSLKPTTTISGAAPHPDKRVWKTSLAL